MLLKKFGIWFLAIEQNDLIVFQMKSEKNLISLYIKQTNILCWDICVQRDYRVCGLLLPSD